MAQASRITSWMAPDAVGGPWYPIDAILPETHAGVLLELALGGDAQPFGCLMRLIDERPVTRYGVRLLPAAPRWQWMEWRHDGRNLAPLCPYRRAVPGIRWTWREPRAFRPLDEAQVAAVLAGARAPVRAWPDVALPAALDGRIRQVAPPPEPEAEPEAVQPSPEATRRDPVRRLAADGWPYPDVPLGDRIPPLTAEEAEARLLRAWRTAESGERVGAHASSTCADIPHEMVMTWRRYADRDRRIDAWQQGLPEDPSLDAKPARWEPDRRDRNDCSYALGWFRHLAPNARPIIALRAALPPFSWRQVGERVRLSPSGARDAYLAGFRGIVTVTNGGDG